jgi:glutathione S-transferase
MQLIGMLDSPYVRRVAVSLQLLGLPFEHRSISVFRGFDAFAAINPVVKAPTLVCDDGTVLMDSTLILDHAESLAAPARRLMPAAPEARLRALRVLAVALAGCEKAVQIVYERARPPERQHAPWQARIRGQLVAACAALEHELQRAPLGLDPIDQAGVTTAVVWTFMRALVPAELDFARHPALEAHTARAEALPAFAAAPHGEAEMPAAASMRTVRRGTLPEDRP